MSEPGIGLSSFELAKYAGYVIGIELEASAKFGTF